MNLTMIADECYRLFKCLPAEFNFFSDMRSTWGLNFNESEAIRKIYWLDDTADPDLMSNFLTGNDAKGLHSTERLLVLLRLKSASECLLLLDDGGRSNIHFQTPESGILWATTNFWRVARYKTVPECVRFYAERNFDQRD